MPRGVSLYDTAKVQGRLWTPALLRGMAYLKAWHDFGDLNTISAASGLVTTCRDKSGFGINLTNNLSIGYGSYGASVTLAGGGYLNSAAQPSSTFDFFVVGTPNSTTTAYRTLMWTAANRLPFTLETGSTRLGVYDGSFKPAGTQVWASGVPGQAFLRLTSTTAVSMSRDGNPLQAVTSPSLTLSTTPTVINNQSGAQGFGIINELIWCSPGLPDHIVDLLQGYLAWKWSNKGIGYNLVNLLPASHPFKNRPPLIGDNAVYVEPTASAVNDLNFYTGGGNAYVIVPGARPATHEYLGTPAGIWSEEALTQGVADPNFSNASSLPNNWQLLPTYSQPATITFTKISDGVGQIRFQGNTSGNVYLQMGAGTQLTCAPGDKLCGSWKWRFVSGSTANTANHGLYIQENDAAGALVNFGPVDFTFIGSPTADRTYHQGVITVAASVARANLGFIYGTTGAYDFTIEISNVQLEKRLWRTSWSPADRALDNLRLAAATETAFLAATSRSVVIEAEAPRYNQNATLWCAWKDASNYIEIQRRNLALFFKVVSAGSTLTDTQVAVLPACSRFKICHSIAPSQVYVSVNGKTATSLAITVPTALTQARLGWGVLGVWNGTIGLLKTDNSAYSAANTAAASAITEDLFDDFDRANGALNGSVAPSGQTWQVTGPQNATSTISSKKWINTSSAAPLADYAIINLGRDMVYGGASFNWDTGTTGGAAAFISADGNVLASTDALHMVAGDGSCTWGVITSGSVDTIDQQWTYTNAAGNAPMARDGSTAYSVAWLRDGNDVHWIGYDGASVMVNAADFAAKSGPWAYFEHYRGAAGVCLPQFTAVSAR